MASGGIKERLSALSSRITIPGWLLILWAALQWVPDWKSRWDFWVGLATSAFKGAPVIWNALNSFLTSPYFSLALLVIGLAYLLIAVRPVHIHHVEMTDSLVLSDQFDAEIKPQSAHSLQIIYDNAANEAH